MEREHYQPELTSHLLERRGPNRGKQRFDVRPQANHKEHRPSERHEQRDRRPSKPRPPKAWTHEADLKSLIGQTVAIGSTLGGAEEAKILEVDAYTLKLEIEGDTYIVFKHSIRSIRVANQA